MDENQSSEGNRSPIPFRYFPDELPRTLLYSLFLFSFFIMVLVDDRYAQTTYPAELRTKFLNSLTYYLDPLLIHIMSVLIVSALIYRLLRIEHNRDSKVIIALIAIAVPIGLLFASFALEQLVLKPAFRYPRPGADALPLGNPWLVKIVLDKYRIPTDPSIQDVPSGFVMRQLILFFLIAWVSFQRNEDNRWLNTFPRHLLSVLNVLAVLFVIFSRMYRSNHTIFAISVALGISTTIFWSFIAVLYAYSPEHRNRYRSFIAENFAVYFSFSFMFFLYSNDAGLWLILSVFVLIILAVAYILPAP